MKKIAGRRHKEWELWQVVEERVNLTMSDRQRYTLCRLETKNPSKTREMYGLIYTHFGSRN